MRRATRTGGGEARAEPASLVLAGRVLQHGKLRPLEIGIGPDGRIVSMGRVVSGNRRHDVGDRVILPAATDLHVHFREPGGSASTESIASGTVQAALGGVGLVGEMPNTEPAVTNLERLEEKADRVRGRAAVDLLLYAAPLDPRAVVALGREAGAFKVYLSPTTGIDAPVPASDLPPLLEAIRRTDLPVTVHAEDPSAFDRSVSARNSGDWNRARPPRAEVQAVTKLLASAPVGLRLHVAHVTGPEVVRQLGGHGVSFEVAPHHLLLSDRSGSDARFKTNPPLRSEATRQELWEAYRQGEVPMVASDHAPHEASLKAAEFARAPSGVPGVETMLPLLLAKVRAGELSLERLVESACERPARWLGQPLGRIEVGHRAQLLVVDFKDRSRVRAEALHAPCGWTPFEGFEAIFPVEHWHDGERIVADGEYVGRPYGRPVRPEFARGVSG